MFRLYQLEVHEETPAPEQRISLGNDEVRSSGIMELMEEVFKELHQEYMLEGLCRPIHMFLLIWRENYTRKRYPESLTGPNP